MVASVDNLRFMVPVATINAGPNPRYFGARRGVPWLNAVNDQYAGPGAVVVPGTIRDSLYILDTCSASTPTTGRTWSSDEVAKSTHSSRLPL